MRTLDVSGTFKQKIVFAVFDGTMEPPYVETRITLEAWKIRGKNKPIPSFSGLIELVSGADKACQIRSIITSKSACKNTVC